MFIQTETTADTDEMRFLPGKPVLGRAGMVSFASPEEARAASPLAARLFAADDDVARVTLEEAAILVRKQSAADWQDLKPGLLVTIMDHFTHEAPALGGAHAADDGGPIAEKIREIIAERIMPVVSRDGGEVIFHRFDDGDAVLELKGSAYGLVGGIENMIRHFVPEVERVVDVRDTIPKPGLETPEGLAVRRLLDEEINPSVAMHGGHIALVDVQDDTVYIRLEGGCQGCGMADVTLKQGVEVAIKNAVPSITAVLDTTDHADGSNPYFQPGKSGMSAY